MQRLNIRVQKPKRKVNTPSLQLIEECSQPKNRNDQSKMKSIPAKLSTNNIIDHFYIENYMTNYTTEEIKIIELYYINQTTIQNSYNQTPKTSNALIGFCIDTGETRALVGKRQVDHCKNFNFHINSKRAPPSLRFRNGIHQCIGTFDAGILLPNKRFLDFKASIVLIDFPFLIGLHVLMEFSVTEYDEN